MIDKSFVEAITQNAQAQTVKVGEREYATRQVFNPPLPDEPVAVALKVTTLTGLVDYCAAYVKSGPEHVLHVRSHSEVALLTDIKGEKRQREVFIVASCGEPSFRFGTFIDHSEFMIAIQSQFEQYGDRDKIMRVVGTIKAEAARTSMDDGITQKVTASSGVTLVQEVALPNPVMLKPYRTFREIAQPPSNFVLRVEKSEDLPDVALFEADGGQWKHEAIVSIREYLASKTSGIAIVA